MTITALPTPPSRDTPSTFSDDADAFLGALPAFGTEANALAVELNTLAAGLDAIAAGGAMSIPYTFSTTTTDSDPGAGILRLDNATQNAATVIRADLLGADGSTWTSVLDTFDDSTNTVKGHIRLIDSADATKFLIFSVSALASPSGYKNITVANVASSAASPFSNGASLIMYFSRAGDVGATGAAGVSGGLVFLSTVSASASATVDLESTFDGTYDSYLIVVSGLVAANSATSLRVRMKIGGSYLTTSTYSYFLEQMKTNGGGTFSADNGDGFDSVKVINDMNNSASASTNLQLWVHSPASATKQKLINWDGVSLPVVGGANAGKGFGGNTGTAALTGIRFFASSGNITSGSFTLYGLKKSA